MHVIAIGQVGGGRRKGPIEVYDRGRFFTVTGNAIRDLPVANCQAALDALETQLGGPAIRYSGTEHVFHGAQCATETDQDLVARIINSAQGPKFKALALGKDSFLQGPDRSGSAIDQSLVNLLRRFTADPAQIERIWISAPVGQRPKTLTRADYRRRTIANVFRPRLILEACESHSPSGSSSNHLERSLR